MTFYKMSLKIEDYTKPRKSKISRSTKLKKYESVYNSYVRKSEQSKRNKSPRIIREKCKTSSNVDKKKKNSNKKTVNKRKKFKSVSKICTI